MTTREACQLILESGAMGNGGEIFVLDMGRPVRITCLAGQMIKLSGKMSGQDMKITYTGSRPGEKLHEELFHENENRKETGYVKIFLATHCEINWRSFENRLSELGDAVSSFDDNEISRLFIQMIPEGNFMQERIDNVLPITGKG